MNPRSILPALLLAVALPSALAQKIEITPATVLLDQTPSIRVTGLAPGASVTLEADLADGAAHIWTSSADFTADPQGVVDLAQQAPSAGSYRTLSATGLIWSMRPLSADTHLYQAPHDLDPQLIRFRLFQDGKQTAAAQLLQSALAPGVRLYPVEGRLHGILFVPPGSAPHPGILVLGGAEGGIPARRAAWLADHGYAAFALAYFDAPGLPGTLQRIPLEYFAEALAWMTQRPEIERSRIAVAGFSRGGEAALQLAFMFPVIKAVVVWNAANVRYPSCCAPNFGPVWTWRKQPLVWVMPAMNPDPITLVHATIPVEDIHAPILFIAGGDDSVWPSPMMLDDMEGRLRAAHFAFPVVTLRYPHAGDRAGFPEVVPAYINGVPDPLTGRKTTLGGTLEGNAASTLDAIPKILAFLQQNLAGTASPVSQSVRPAQSAH